MSKIKAICISEKKGTQKHPVDSANLVEDWGIEGDAHAGHWHRQVSLLSFEKVEAFRARGARVDFGAFGENLVVEGFDFRSLPVGTRFQCGGVLLEMTQIGKECHAHCAIYQVMGDCIMPREGVFARVIRGGRLHVGDELTLLPPDPTRPPGGSGDAQRQGLPGRARRRERAPAGPSARRGGLRGGGGTSPSRRAGPHPD